MGTSAIPKLYYNLEGIFSEEKANELPVSSSYNHKIKLERDCQSSYSLIYPLSTLKLQVLREYLLTVAQRVRSHHGGFLHTSWESLQLQLAC